MPDRSVHNSLTSFRQYVVDSQHILDRLANTLYSRSMDTTIAEHRLRVLTFWKAHGLEATKDAFGISRTSLYRWQRSYVRARKNVTALTPRSRARRNNNSRTVDSRLTLEVIRLRTCYPGLGKEKLYPLVFELATSLAIPAPSVSTIGRLVMDLKRGGRLPSRAKLRFSVQTDGLRQIIRDKKPKTRRSGYRPQHPGDLLQIDTVITFIDGVKRYTLTAIDLTSRFAFAWSYGTHSSASATDFFRRLELVARFKVQHVQTDNGSEFMEHFRVHLEQAGVTHFFNYPRRPQWNGTVERFNRTIQDEFLSYHKQTLAYDLEEFNRLLVDWLLWYNSRRMHLSIRASPMDFLIRKHGLSHLAWTHTAPCLHA